MTGDEWRAMYISLPIRLKERAKVAAKNDRRTLAKWIELLIEDHLDGKCETSSSDTPSQSSESSSSPSPLESTPETHTGESSPVTSP